MAKASKAQLEANRRWRKKNKDYTEYKEAMSYVDNLIDPSEDKNVLIYNAINSDDDRFDYWEDMHDILMKMADKLGYSLVKKK